MRNALFKYVKHGNFINGMYGSMAISYDPNTEKNVFQFVRKTLINKFNAKEIKFSSICIDKAVYEYQANDQKFDVLITEEMLSNEITLFSSSLELLNQMLEEINLNRDEISISLDYRSSSNSP